MPTIKAVRMDTLKLDPDNARKHGETDIGAIAKSLESFGQQTPIVIDASKTIVKGNGTYLAAMRLGWETIDVIQTRLTGEQLRAYAIADNQTALLSEWDEPKLIAQLKELEDTQWAESLGFPDDELQELLGVKVKEGNTDPDAIPEVTGRTITQPGDVWELDGHRLVCGDATSEQAYELLLRGESVDLLLTDPPYNVDYQGGMKQRAEIAADRQTDKDFGRFLKAAFGLAFGAMKPGASFYIWHADVKGYAFRKAVMDLGQEIRQCLVWVKSSATLGRQDYRWRHEPCITGWKGGAAHRWYGDLSQETVQEETPPPDFNRMSKPDLIQYIRDMQASVSNETVLREQRPPASDEHPTMKPVRLMQRLIENSTAAGDVILDPFAGSGSTIIAAERVGRRVYSIELEPRYCDVIVKRWEQYTGKNAVRVATLPQAEPAA